MLNIDMLGMSMVLGIVCKCDSSLVICKDGDRRELPVQVSQNLTEEEANPNCFRSSLSEYHILRLGRGQGHTGLFVDWVGDWRLTSQKDLSTSPMVRIQTPSPIAITVASDLCIPYDLAILGLGQRSSLGSRLE